MTALHQFGAEMLKLSRGLESVGAHVPKPTTTDKEVSPNNNHHIKR